MTFDCVVCGHESVQADIALSIRKTILGNDGVTSASIWRLFQAFTVRCEVNADMLGAALYQVEDDQINHHL